MMLNNNATELCQLRNVLDMMDNNCKSRYGGALTTTMIREVDMVWKLGAKARICDLAFGCVFVDRMPV